jgi:hypothetical protein
LIYQVKSFLSKSEQRYDAAANLDDLFVISEGDDYQSPFDNDEPKIA